MKIMINNIIILPNYTLLAGSLKMYIIKHIIFKFILHMNIIINNIQNLSKFIK